MAKTFKGHESNIHQILPFANHLITLDEDNILKVFEIDTADAYLSLNFPIDSFQITCMLHPVSYLNKILLASKQGTMQLWNMKTSKMVYTYKSFNSGVTCLRQAPAIDVCGVGLEDGRIVLHNLKFDETVMSFMQEWGPVKSLTFRTGSFDNFNNNGFNNNGYTSITLPFCIYINTSAGSLALADRKI